MAITISDTQPRVQYTASAGQTSFTVPFEFFANADLEVFNGTSLLSFSASPSSASQYSVTGAGVTGGGSITLGGSGAALNDIITISRDVAIERTTDFPTSGAFQIASLNEELDKLVAMIQQVETETKYSPKFSKTTNVGFDIAFPTPVANKVINFNSSGNGLEAVHSITDIQTVAGSIANIDTVGASISNVNAVAGNASNINTVAGSIANVNTLAGISGLSTLAANSANVTTAATNIASINTNATNISAIQNASANADSAAASASAAAASAASAQASAGGGAVKITSNDTAQDVLNTKLLVSGGLTKTVNNPGGNESLTLTAQAAEVYGFKKSFVTGTYNILVTVQSVDGANKYFIDGVQQDVLYLYEGNTYIFTHPSAHPLRFSTDSGNSSAYNTGVTVNSSTQVTIVVASGSPTLYYYCSNHANMGGVAYTPVGANNNLQVQTTNGGANNITNAEFNSFTDVIYGAGGMTWSINTDGELRVTI